MSGAASGPRPRICATWRSIVRRVDASAALTAGGDWALAAVASRHTASVATRLARRSRINVRRAYTLRPSIARAARGEREERLFEAAAACAELRYQYVLCR